MVRNDGKQTLKQAAFAKWQSKINFAPNKFKSTHFQKLPNYEIMEKLIVIFSYI